VAIVQDITGSACVDIVARALDVWSELVGVRVLCAWVGYRDHTCDEDPDEDRILPVVLQVCLQLSP
jgi:hypothetical protein